MREQKSQKFIRYSASIVLGSAFFLIPLTSFAASLSELQRQQTSKQQQAAAAAAAAAAAQKQADAINGQILNLDQQISVTENAITDTENQISQTQMMIDDLTNKIKSEQDQLNSEKQKLDSVIVSWYMERDNLSLTYALLSSDTLSDAVTKWQYYDSVKQQIQIETDKISKMKAELEKEKADQDNKIISLKSLKDQKQNYYDTAVSQKSYKNKLLNGTLAQKQDYLDRTSELQKEIHKISDAIYALRQQQGGYTAGGNGGYPYSAIDSPDPWNFYTRECTSYAAWYWNIVLGKKWYNTQPGRGNAKYWPEIARTLGYSVNQTPKIGAIISWQGNGTIIPSDTGHAAIVQAVNGDGTIDWSQYNWSPYAYSYVSHGNPGDYGSFSYIY